MWRNDDLPESEIFTPERIAEFLLNNSLIEEEYRENLVEVIAMGVDPVRIPLEYLDRQESWKRAESYPDLLTQRQTV